MTTIYTSTLSSPLGLLYLAHANDCLYALDFVEYEDRFNLQLGKRFPEDKVCAGDNSPLIQQLLADYFAGDIQSLNKIQVHLPGTAFQQQVWQGLRAIPGGKTASYQELAHAIGCKSGQRAVGAANGKNPIPLVVPCHRVINANGKLGGYNGDLWRKEWLLRHEGALFL